MSGDRRRLAGAERRPLKGYAPLVVLVGALVAMVVIVPSTVPDELASATSAGPRGGRRRPAGDGLGRHRHGVHRPRAAGARTSATRRPASRFSGDNGGATSARRHRRHRQGQLPPDGRPQPAGAAGPAGRGAPRRDQRGDAGTAEALVEYFNNTFEFYGRKIELVGYEGRGLILPSSPAAGRTRPPTTASRWPTRSGPSPTSPASPSPTPTPWPATRSSTSGRRTCPASGSRTTGPTPGAPSPTARPRPRCRPSTRPTGCSAARPAGRRTT